jgi:hypothetical protein
MESPPQVQYQTVILFLFILVKGRKIRSWRRTKRRALLQTEKPDQVIYFQYFAQKNKRIASKTVGKLYKCPPRTMLVSPTKCGNCEQSANGSERAYKSGVLGCTSSLEE